MTLRTSGRGTAGASFFSRCFVAFGLLVNTIWSLSGTTGAGAFLGLPLGPWLLFGAIALDVGGFVNINDQDTEIIERKWSARRAIIGMDAALRDFFPRRT